MEVEAVNGERLKLPTPVYVSGAPDEWLRTLQNQIEVCLASSVRNGLPAQPDLLEGIRPGAHLLALPVIEYDVLESKLRCLLMEYPGQVCSVLLRNFEHLYSLLD